MEKSEGKCACPCHRMIGVLVVLFGLTFLLGAFQVLSSNTVAIVWPILVILAGLKTIFRGMCKCCDAA